MSLLIPISLASALVKGSRIGAAWNRFGNLTSRRPRVDDEEYAGQLAVGAVDADAPT